MATKVEEAIAEIDAKLAEYAPQHEGLRDYHLLNLREETKTVIAESIAQYDQRKAALDAAKAALEALMADGHPDLSVKQVEQLVYNDLKENAATIEAALSKFTPHVAASLGLGAGLPEMKIPKSN